jgi:hypothetical protein
MKNTCHIDLNAVGEECQGDEGGEDLSLWRAPTRKPSIYGHIWYFKGE